MFFLFCSLCLYLRLYFGCSNRIWTSCHEVSFFPTVVASPFLLIESFRLRTIFGMMSSSLTDEARFLGESLAVRSKMSYFTTSPALLVSIMLISNKQAPVETIRNRLHTLCFSHKARLGNPCKRTTRHCQTKLNATTNCTPSLHPSKLLSSIIDTELVSRSLKHTLTLLTQLSENKVSENQPRHNCMEVPNPRNDSPLRIVYILSFVIEL